MHSPTTSTWPVTHGNALRLCSFIMAIRSFKIGWLRQWHAMGATGWTNCAFSSALAYSRREAGCGSTVRASQASSWSRRKRREAHGNNGWNQNRQRSSASAALAQ
ncbi:hypothetical protein D9M72_541130 [compost metagenome]